MKKIISCSIYVALTILHYSCGIASSGVIGNIEKYRFNNVSIDSLKIAVAKVYKSNSMYRNFDTTVYKEGQSIGDADYYCRIEENGKDYFFAFGYVQYEPEDTFVEIALMSASTYGGNLNLASNIGFFDKIKYRRIFEKYFINEVNKELKEKQRYY